VLHTAVDAYNLDVKAAVLSSCTASFSEDGHEFALGHFKNTLGMKVTDNIE